MDMDYKAYIPDKETLKVEADRLREGILKNTVTHIHCEMVKALSGGESYVVIYATDDIPDWAVMEACKLYAEKGYRVKETFSHRYIIVMDDEAYAEDHMVKAYDGYDL